MLNSLVQIKQERQREEGGGEERKGEEKRREENKIIPYEFQSILSSFLYSLASLGFICLTHWLRKQYKADLDPRTCCTVIYIHVNLDTR